MSGKRNVKTNGKTDRQAASQTETVLRRLLKAPETAHQIYELAESLYSRCGNGDAARISLADIERIGEYLREVETDDKRIKKQFAELATVSAEFYPPKIPFGF